MDNKRNNNQNNSKTYKNSKNFLKKRNFAKYNAIDKVKELPESKEIERNILIAYQCIGEFEDKETPIDDFLDDFFGNEYSLERKRSSSLVFCYYRNKALIDYIVRASADKISKRIRRLLAIGTTLMHFQEALHTPVIVDVIVEISKEKFGRVKGNFVNAVLRTIGRASVDILLKRVPKNVLYNFSRFYYSKLLENFSVNEMQELSDIYREIPPLTLRMTKALSDEEITEFDLTKIELPEWSNNATFFKVNNAQSLFRSEILKEGKGYIQDPSTIMAVNLLELTGDESIIDLCAAPGGKSIYMAEKLNNNGELTACDRSERRLKYLRENFAARNFQHKICCLDLLDKESEDNDNIKAQQFDVVVIDVPCSNTGVIRHRPDAIWRLNKQSLTEVMLLQKDILEAAAKLVKKGGVLLYSTCSIEKDENNDLIREFIEENGSDKWSIENEMQLIPTLDFDGAYGAVIKKTC